MVDGELSPIIFLQFLLFSSSSRNFSHVVFKWKLRLCFLSSCFKDNYTSFVKSEAQLVLLKGGQIDE